MIKFLRRARINNNNNNTLLFQYTNKRYFIKMMSLVTTSYISSFFVPFFFRIYNVGAFWVLWSFPHLAIIFVASFVHQTHARACQNSAPRFRLRRSIFVFAALVVVRKSERVVRLEIDNDDDEIDDG